MGVSNRIIRQNDDEFYRLAVNCLTQKLRFGRSLRLGRCAGDAPNLFRGAHRFEGARHDLRRAGAADLVTRLRFEQLGVRKDDPELVVQTVEEETQFRRFVH